MKFHLADLIFHVMAFQLSLIFYTYAPGYMKYKTIIGRIETRF